MENCLVIFGVKELFNIKIKDWTAMNIYQIPSCSAGSIFMTINALIEVRKINNNLYINPLLICVDESIFIFMQTVSFVLDGKI